MSWTIHALWKFVESSASVATLIGCGALAVAILEPTILARYTDLRKWALAVAAVAFSYVFIGGYFYHLGLAEKQAEWDRALVQEVENGKKALDDAIAAEPVVPTDRRLFSGDHYNRDSGKSVYKR
jgi:hypothetical protein